MEMTQLEHAVRILAICGGILFGSVAIGSASWVWVKKQIFAFGGSGLCLAGIVLMGLSVWKTVDVRATSSGLEMKLGEIEQQLQRTNRQMASLTFAAGGGVTDEMKQNLNGIEADLKETKKAIADLTNTTRTLRTEWQRTSNLVGFRILERPIRVSPEAAPYIQTAIKNQAEGNIAGAASAYEMAIGVQQGKFGSNNSDIAQMYFNLGELLQMQGKSVEAATSYQKGADALVKERK